ncbi:MAG: peptidase U32 family protein, partial [Candidatus Cloacimonadaceae bacterium]|nr:peptidase U32 family protein [Candidatus Cloacimonadaceae bacterium]
MPKNSSPRAKSVPPSRGETCLKGSSGKPRKEHPKKAKALVERILPELLLPAGHPEAFLAALEGGADAIYLGIDQFNARNRAKNFQLNELPALIKKAREFESKVYLTLNTLIKNNEIKNLIKILSCLEHIPIDALIIQDWGVFGLIKKHFPDLKLHGSTQIGIHNSLEANFHSKLGFERVIMARELSWTELEMISQRSKAHLEIFAHGALCYSFSGYCLMSSWLGGNSANRGQCRQPCRQLYHSPSGADRIFCMKDFELIDYLPQICA